MQVVPPLLQWIDRGLNSGHYHYILLVFLVTYGTRYREDHIYYHDCVRLQVRLWPTAKDFQQIAACLRLSGVRASCWLSLASPFRTAASSAGPAQPQSSLTFGPAYLALALQECSYPYPVVQKSRRRVTGSHSRIQILCQPAFDMPPSHFHRSRLLSSSGPLFSSTTAGRRRWMWILHGCGQYA
ncbi:uncharacterized protein K489DRAFT_47969 [Dissoconium aciculare CBS 342.82]|uniref:Uncharacterized protein n=1 Tax=Dissoconium aciculare CBS 342.82 TaxID=1314786 RepID=A0A6J3LXZ0_9PEZI|nr:uncharacterized protein K489DRAFT_47969 [Dissoconium aciculare CBS 342.82]KAF1820154.1 hypothetical protein K489DRAFT_47969 [Dissoconium aciculare CBS 342.82]